MGLSLQALAKTLSLQATGDATIAGVAAVEDAGHQHITFVNTRAYLKSLPDCQAGAVILKPEWQSECPLPCLLTDDPYYTYAQICHLLYPDQYNASPDIDQHAVIAESVKIGEKAVISANVSIAEGVVIGKGCYIAPGVVIHKNSVIGDDVRLHANVVVEHDCIIGDRVIIHPGAVIGADGFGLASKNGIWLKIPQVGRVVIHDDVEIGANTTIDRGANRDTVIAQGVKLDNLIQVAHNVHIGAHTAIAAKVGIAGSTKIGEHCTIGGAAVILGHLSIADNTHIYATSLVTNDITASGHYASGTPLEPVKQWRKNRVRIKQLDDMAKKLKDLVKKQ